MLLFSGAEAYMNKNELHLGKEYFDEANRLLASFDSPFISSWAYSLRGNLAAAYQNTTEAEEYLLQAVDLVDRLGDQRMAALARSGLAHLYRHEGRLDDSLALYRQTILVWQEQGHQSAVAHQLECFAYIAVARQQYEQAARLLGAAGQARELLDARSTDKREIEELAAAVRQLETALGAAERDRVMTMGARLSLDEAVTLALSTDQTFS